MSVANEIYDILAEEIADIGSDLHDILTGGAWKRPLLRTGPGATPDAFDASGRVKPAVVVPDRGETGDPFGIDDPAADLSAFLAVPDIWCYAPATESGKTAIESAFAIIRPMLHGTVVDGQGSTSVGLRVVGRQGITDDPILAGSVVDVLRLQADGLWSS